MTTPVLSWQHPFAGTSRPRRCADFIPAPAGAGRASRSGPQSGPQQLRQRPVRSRQRLSALSDLAKIIPAKPAVTPNPHRPPSAHRFPAGSFFGGFPTPAPTPGRSLALGRHPKPLTKAALAGPQWNREARPSRDILGYTVGSLGWPENGHRRQNGRHADGRLTSTHRAVLLL